MPDDSPGFFRSLSGLATTWVQQKQKALQSDPKTQVDSAGSSHSYEFGGQDITFEDLREIKEMRESGGQVAQLMQYKALLNFGEGAEFHVEDNEETTQLVDGEPVTLEEWLEEQAFPHIDLLTLDLGEDAMWYPAAVGELRENQVGDFAEFLPAEPWTLLPETNKSGEIIAWHQEVKRDGGRHRQTLAPEDIVNIVLNKQSARDKTGISEVLRNRDEIQAFKENEQAINQAIELHGFPQRHVKVGREDGAPVRDDELRRVRTIFDPRTTDANTAYFTGQDVDVETLEAHQFDYTAIHEMDMRNLTTALGLPLEAGNVGSDGLGSGKPAELRFALLKLAIKANQRSFSQQFVKKVVNPVVRDYSPFDHSATVRLEIDDPLEDIGEVADLINSVGDYMTNAEARRKLDLPEPEDEEISEGYQSPADMEAPEDQGGFGGDGGLFRQAREMQSVPDNAVSISDRSEAPEGASVIEGPGGGLYYVPGGSDGNSGGDVDSDIAEEVVGELPSEYDGSDEQREQLGSAASELVESGASYSEAVETIESEVSGLDTDAQRTVRQQAFVNRSARTEIAGNEVEVSPVVRTAFSRDKSDMREAAEEMLEDRVEYGEQSIEYIEEQGEGWVSMGDDEDTLLNSQTADFWTVATDELGNSEVPSDATATADASMADEERQDILDQRDNTQEVLQEMFGESVPVQRGVSGEFAEQIREAKENGEPVELEHRALESWTTFPDIAEQFATEETTADADAAETEGVIITTEMPVKDVWASSHTTPGIAERENELIVGNEGAREYDPDNIHIADDGGLIETYDDSARR